MLFSKSYIRKTKKGSVIKVVKEHYLRDDIYCGVPGCTSCPSEQENSSFLGSSPRNIGSPHSTYVIPDTNVLYHQIDLMEHKSTLDFIILQTVLEELRHRSPSIYGRIRSLIADPDKRFYVFCNEHHRETFLERETQETQNDRNDRAIRKAVGWYNDHIQDGRKVILVTDDSDCRSKAAQEGLVAISVSEYVNALSDEFPTLVDLISAVGTEDLDETTRFKYPEHLSKTQISAGLKSGAFHQGTLSISNHNYLEGSVFINDETVYIIGRENLNRGIQGDVVAVQILPQSEWISIEGEAVLEEDVIDKDGEEDKIEKTEETLTGSSSTETKMDTSVTESTPRRKTTGRVVGIIKRNWRPLCGTIDASSVQATSSTSSIQSVFFWAMDKRIPKVRIRTRQANLLIGKRIVVSIDAWTKDSKYPAGHYVRTLGDVGDRQTETQVLLLEHDVPFAPFSPLVLSCLPEEGESWIVRDDLHLDKREDFRGLDICSIDPPGCTDIDDALHARYLSNGNLEVGVHIADVSHFVKPGNAMDLEAQRRGTTVYLVDRRIDMLPGLLGTNLCSLRSNVDRLAFSCIWEMTPEAEVLNVRYTKSVIRSKASLTYDEAQARLDDPNMKDSISEGIRILNSLAKKMREKRMERGALTLASPEVRFSLENDSQDPVDVELKELKDTNALVEEFMLLANIYVARKIYETFPDSSMLRRHPKPPSSNFTDLSDALAMFGFSLDTSTSKTLSDSLDQIVVKDDPYFNKLVRIMTTRCMMQAVYFCSGTLPQTEFWHYGLASDIYTHFTSPIRRYADLQVHRLLAACIEYEENVDSSLLDKVAVEEMAQVLNFRHRMAQQASRSSVELYTHLFFKGKQSELQKKALEAGDESAGPIGIVESAYVIRKMKNGCAVLIPKYGIEGILYTENQEMDTQIDDHVPTEVKLFQPVWVRISVEEAGVAAAQRSKLVLRWASKPAEVDVSDRPAKKTKI